MYIYKYIYNFSYIHRGCSSVVERSLCMREARGSKPRSSNYSFVFNFNVALCLKKKKHILAVKWSDLKLV